MVMSVPSMSLSIDPTRPAIISAGCRSAVALVDVAAGHEFLDQRRPFLAQQVGAADRLPSPPMTTSRSMPA